MNVLTQEVREILAPATIAAYEARQEIECGSVTEGDAVEKAYHAAIQSQNTEECWRMYNALVRDAECGHGDSGQQALYGKAMRAYEYATWSGEIVYPQKVCFDAEKIGKYVPCVYRMLGVKPELGPNEFIPKALPTR